MSKGLAIAGLAVLALNLCAVTADAQPLPRLPLPAEFRAKPKPPAKPAARPAPAKAVKKPRPRSVSVVQPPAPALPAALLSDTPRDPAHPSENAALRLNSKGSLINAVFYLASGTQPHPTVLLLHGLPGNEQNLDLAQSLRRAGYNVLTLHYRGSWGSGGTFGLSRSVEDGQVALDFLLDPVHVAGYHIDPRRVIVMGHSMGGFVAVRAAAADPRVAGIGLIAPWDIADALAPLTVPMADLPKTAAKMFDDVDGRLGSVTSLDIAKEILTDGKDWRLASSAGAIANRPILIVTASHDGADSKAGNLVQVLALTRAGRVRTVELDSDHGFSDHRIALQTEVLTWLKQNGL